MRVIFSRSGYDPGRDDRCAPGWHSGGMVFPPHKSDRSTGQAPGQNSARRRPPRKATAKHLENVALSYLARFQATAKSLERVLMRRVARSAHQHGTDATEGRALVDDLITRYRKSGLLDDSAFARARALRLHGRGKSVRAIRAELAQKGVTEMEIGAALAGLWEEVPEDTPPDLAAAKRTAKRRRLGPWRPEDQRQERREKDLAALARAGFSYSVARQVIDEEC